MHHFSLFVIVPLFLAVCDVLAERTEGARCVGHRQRAQIWVDDARDVDAVKSVNPVTKGKSKQLQLLTDDSQDIGSVTEVPVQLGETCMCRRHRGVSEVRSFLLPVDSVKDAESDSEGNNSELETIHQAEKEFQIYMDKAKVPEGEHCTESKQLSFAFAIGSIFNDESKNGYRIKNELMTKGIRKPEDNIDMTSKKCSKVVNESHLACPQFATVDSGFRRMWTYPSGGGWKIWAVSLHKDENSTSPVLGALTQVDQEWYGMMRPREQDYEVLPIDPELITLTKMNQTLRQAYPCDQILAFAYGYNTPMADLTEGIQDIFWHTDLGRKPEYEVMTLAPPNTFQLCDLSEFSLAERDHCQVWLRKSYGHVLVQSYIDVIIAGILETGFVTNVAHFHVHGGASTEYIKANYSHLIDYARLFAATTTWPVHEVVEKKVLYINDRPCPRNPNPMYTPQEHLHPEHMAGISSTAPDTQNLYTMIDEIIRESSEDGKTFVNNRINGMEVCEKLDVLPRWLDGVLGREMSLWDFAYRSSPPKTPIQMCHDV